MTPTTQCSDDEAADEGWNPGLHDADSFWQTDPGAFVAAELDGEVIGAGSIASYDGLFGFMGFFIVRPRFRGRGYGSVIWQARKRLLLDRLSTDVTIGMDGVLEMQDWYKKGGFEFAYRQLRFVARSASSPPERQCARRRRWRTSRVSRSTS